MTDPIPDLTDREFWRRYWTQRDPVRLIDNRFYYAGLLRRAVADVDAVTFIELGGFPGHFAVFAARYLGLEPTLVDSYIDHDVVRRLATANGLGGDTITVVEADFRTYEPDRLYDVVLSAGLVEHFDDVEPVLRRHLDFLRPGGLLVVTLPNYLGLNGWFQARFDPDHLAAHNLRTMDVAYLREVMERLRVASFRVGHFGKFRVWLEDLNLRPPAVRLLVRAVQVAGLPLDLVGIRSKLTSPHVAIVARK